MNEGYTKFTALYFDTLEELQKAQREAYLDKDITMLSQRKEGSNWVWYKPG